MNNANSSTLFTALILDVFQVYGTTGVWRVPIYHEKIGEAERGISERFV